MINRTVAILGSVILCLFVMTNINLAQREQTRGPATAAANRRGAGTLPLESQSALVNQYCTGCHNDKTKSGGMTLANLDLAHTEKNAELAEKIIRKLRAGMMPPPGAKRPEAETSQAFAASLESAIDKAAAAHPNPGRRGFQRLSQTEYARSIHDLLNIDVDVAALLPPDSLHDGFDNIAEAQSFSPAVLEGYIRAAARITIEALGDPQATATSATYTLPHTTNQLRHVEGAPFGTRGGISVVHNFPADGEYVFNVKLQAATNGGLIGRRSPNEQIEVSINGERAALLNINPNISESAGNGLNVRTGPIFVKAGSQRVSAAFLPRFSGLVDDLVAPIEYTLADAIGAAQLFQVPHLQDFNITGPYTVTGVSDTPGRRKVFKCRPATAEEELPCATNIMTSLARQAYRRPVTQEDLEGLLAFYEMGRKDADFESGVRTALQAILASPHFVFRLEHRPAKITPGQNYRISNLELASRLSYFLWSTAPDEALITVAGAGQLHDPVELEKQVRRMLADPRSESLSTRFAAQWLRLAELDNMVPDALLYPNFDRTLAQAMRKETELLFDSVAREDRNVLDLLTADYTFVNERLALAGATALWRAAQVGDVDAMRLLVAAGADPNMPTTEGVTPLLVAAGDGFHGNDATTVPYGRMPAVKYLVEECKADVNALDKKAGESTSILHTNSRAYTPLHSAAARGDNEMILYLVSKGARVDIVGKNGVTVADMANGPRERIQPFPETVKLLVGLGAKNSNRCVSC